MAALLVVGFSQRLNHYIMLKFVQNNKVTFILLLLFISFKSLWESIVEIWVVEPVLSRFSCNLPTTLLFVVVCILLLAKGYNMYRQRRMVSDQVAGLSLACLGVWAWYRFGTDTAYPLYGMTGLCYVDIIAVACLVYIIPRFWKRKPLEDGDPNVGFVVDEPIASVDDDLLGRGVHAKDAAKKLIQTPACHGAFTLGIVAPWGEGKSSFMAMMKESLEKMDNEELIILEFNPWRYSKESNLTRVFLEELSNKLSLVSTELSRMIRNYAIALGAMDNEWTKIGARLLQGISDKNTMERYEELRECTKLMNRKVVVFIDDIDRLGGVEIEEVFRLVRNVSNLPNLYFVLAYDKMYVVDALRPLFGSQSLSYTDKIMQEEYVIPKVTEAQLYTHLRQLFREFLGSQGEQQIDLLLKEKSYYKVDLYRYFKTLRDVKRLGNHIRSHYSRLKEDVNLYDWLIYNLLRTHYPQVQRLIELKQAEIFRLDDKRVAMYDKDLVQENTYGGNPIIIKEYIEKNKDVYYLTDDDVEQVKAILDALWGRYRQAEPCNINHVLYMQRYFHHSLLEQDIPEREFKRLLTLSYPEMKPVLRDWAENHSYFVVKRFRDMKPINRDGVKSLLQVIFYFNEISRGSTFDGRDIDRQMRYLYRSHSEGFHYDGQDKEFVYQLLKERNNHAHILEYIQEVEKEGGEYPLTQEELIGLQKYHFEAYVKENPDDIENVYKAWLNSAVPIETGGYKYHEECNQLFRLVAERNFERFIPLTISFYRPNDNRWYKLNTLHQELWGSDDAYCDYVKAIANPSKIIEEYIEFLEKNRQKESEQLVHFLFQEIKLDE